jgi:hypothetical protein
LSKISDFIKFLILANILDIFRTNNKASNRPKLGQKNTHIIIVSCENGVGFFALREAELL